MSESDNAGGVRVNDRRRFDHDGNPKSSSAEPEGGELREREAVWEEAPQQEAPGEEAAALRGEVQELRLKLEAAYRRVDELARAVQSGERDREDFKKRLTRERERMIDVEKGNVAQVLLDSVDELDLSLQNAGDSPLAQGVKMIRDGILSRLAGLGVERLQLEGRPFDPNLAEAVDMEVTTSPDEDQRVLQELRPAYQLKDRVIRPGRVKVARYVEPAKA